MPKKIPEKEIRDYILKNHEVQTRKQIAWHFGVCETTIYEIAKRAGVIIKVPVRTLPRKRVKEAIIFIELNEHLSINEMAERLSLSEQSVRDICKYYELKYRHRYEKQKVAGKFFDWRMFNNCLM